MTTENKPFPAISLTRIGMDCVVSIEIDGQWVPVIVDNGETISHIAEPSGIEAAIKRDRRGRQKTDWSRP